MSIQLTLSQTKHLDIIPAGVLVHRATRDRSASLCFVLVVAARVRCAFACVVLTELTLSQSVDSTDPFSKSSVSIQLILSQSQVKSSEAVHSRVILS